MHPHPSRHTAQVLYPVFPASVFRGAFKLPSGNLKLPPPTEKPFICIIFLRFRFCSSNHDIVFAVGPLKGKLFPFPFLTDNPLSWLHPFLKGGLQFLGQFKNFSFLTGLPPFLVSLCVTYTQVTLSRSYCSWPRPSSPFHLWFHSSPGP